MPSQNSRRKNMCFFASLQNCCNSKRKKTRPEIVRVIPDSHNQEMDSPDRNELMNMDNAINILPIEKPFKSNLVIQSSFSPESVLKDVAEDQNHENLDLKYVESISQTDVEARNLYKYYCPICMRYFTRILQSDCCQNYMCVLCAVDLQKQEAKSHIHIQCPFGCLPIEPENEPLDLENENVDLSGKFVLIDIDEKQKPKKYTDSQQAFFASHLMKSNYAASSSKANQFWKTVSQQIPGPAYSGMNLDPMSKSDFGDRVRQQVKDIADEGYNSSKRSEGQKLQNNGAEQQYTSDDNDLNRDPYNLLQGQQLLYREGEQPTQRQPIGQLSSNCNSEINHPYSNNHNEQNNILSQEFVIQQHQQPKLKLVRRLSSQNSIGSEPQIIPLSDQELNQDLEDQLQKSLASKRNLNLNYDNKPSDYLPMTNLLQKQMQIQPDNVIRLESEQSLQDDNVPAILTKQTNQSINSQQSKDHNRNPLSPLDIVNKQLTQQKPNTIKNKNLQISVTNSNASYKNLNNNFEYNLSQPEIMSKNDVQHREIQLQYQQSLLKTDEQESLIQGMVQNQNNIAQFCASPVNSDFVVGSHQDFLAAPMLKQTIQYGKQQSVKNNIYIKGLGDTIGSYQHFGAFSPPNVGSSQGKGTSQGFVVNNGGMPVEVSYHRSNSQRSGSLIGHHTHASKIDQQSKENTRFKQGVMPFPQHQLNQLQQQQISTHNSTQPVNSNYIQFQGDVQLRGIRAEERLSVDSNHLYHQHYDLMQSLPISPLNPMDKILKNSRKPTGQAICSEESCEEEEIQKDNLSRA